MRESHTKPMTLDQAITALADGTLRGKRRKEAEARLAERPDLLVSLERQRQALALLRERTPGLRPMVRTDRGATTAGGKRSQA